MPNVISILILFLPDIEINHKFMIDDILLLLFEMDNDSVEHIYLAVNHVVSPPPQPQFGWSSKKYEKKN